MSAPKFRMKGSGIRASNPEFLKWLKNRVPTREAHALFHTESAEEWLAAIETDAEQWLQRLQAATRSGEKAAIKRAAFGNLKTCAVSLAEPLPPSLVKLVGVLMDLKPARTAIKNRKQFLAVARHFAEHSKPSLSSAKRAVGGDHDTIKAWLNRRDFQEAVGRFKASAAAGTKNTLGGSKKLRPPTNR